jgi:hypothetical protein
MKYQNQTYSRSMCWALFPFLLDHYDYLPVFDRTEIYLEASDEFAALLF